MKWHFSPLLNDQVETEVTQRDQFNNDDLNISETIVRETVQNSLDAAADSSQPIKVTFRWLHKKDGLSETFFQKLFDGQIEHAKVAGLDTASLDFNNPTVLVIEDFGTTGLTGSVSEIDENNFSDFWRRHGKSHKSGKNRGRWGLGKLVYSQSSRIGAFFGITKRNNDDTIYLMGQTVLNLRKVGGKRYPPHAFFGDLENPDDMYSRIPVPVKDRELVDGFIRNFCLKRKSESGLSVVIPFPNKSFRLEKMIEVAIANYFYPLLTGQLLLTFNDVDINASNIRSLAKQYASSRIEQIDLLFNFIEEAFHSRQSEIQKLLPSWTDGRRIDENDFHEEALQVIRDRFSTGKMVSLLLPVTIKAKNGNIIESDFSLHLKRPDELLKGEDLYVRGGLTLPKESKFGGRRAIGALIADDEPICAFLGDAENASHTKWVANSERLRKKYKAPQPMVSSIKNSLVQLYDLLTETASDIDREALQNFFWFEEPEEGKRKRRKKKKDPAPVPKIESSKPLINISKIEGGFTLTSTADFTEDRLPHNVKVELAYEVSKGNAFKKYSPLDFMIGKDILIDDSSIVNTKIHSADRNLMEIEITGLPFKLSVRGFDPNRDLKVKTK